MASNKVNAACDVVANADAGASTRPVSADKIAALINAGVPALIKVIDESSLDKDTKTAAEIALTAAQLAVSNALADYLDDGQWELLAGLVYQSDVAARTFTAPAGFITKFASMPRIPIVYELAGDTASNAVTVHDYLYSTHIVPRSVADAVSREASDVTAVPDWRRQLMWAGVRVCGWLYWG